MSETEIKMRNPKLRLGVNIALVTLFVIVFIWQAAGTMSARSHQSDIRAEVTVLERDSVKNEQIFLTEQTLSEQSRKNLTAQGQVQESQRLQALRDKMESSRAMLQQRRDQLDKLSKDIGMHRLIIILSLVGALVLLGVNYMLDY